MADSTEINPNPSVVQSRPSIVVDFDGEGDDVVSNAALDVPEVRSEHQEQSAVFAVENMNCGGCMRKIEREIGLQPGIQHVRANLTKKRVHVVYDVAQTGTDLINSSLEGLGFQTHQLIEEDESSVSGDSDLLRRLGVAGFASANVMLLSVAVWAGLASDMDKVSMTLFHWLSALIALPAIGYAGQPFFRSARQALKVRQLNMDVPISLAVVLATGMSLFQTIKGEAHVYFDASLTLLFFLLIGRYLDHAMRSKARSAVQNLMELKSETAALINDDGTLSEIPTRHLMPGQKVLVAAGASVPADGDILSGETMIDEALLTGESEPRLVGKDDQVYAGTINHTAPIQIVVRAAANDTVFSEIARLMEVAEQARGRYVRLADRAAAIYAPGIHLIGAFTFLGWMAFGAGWEQSLLVAISVLIITCPCALALAVPAVQVAAAARLFSNGLILKSGDGLERLSETDYVVFDKTGTLTLGRPALQNSDEIDDEMLKRAAEMAAASLHPYSRAILQVAEKRFGAVTPLSDVAEYAGLGLSYIGDDGEWRLGSPGWCQILNEPNTGEDLTGPGEDKKSILWLAGPSGDQVAFHFIDPLRADAVEMINRLKSRGVGVELLSGDRRELVRSVAQTTGIKLWSGEMKPDDKIKRLGELENTGHRVLMVGDGLNDAPALSAGHASIAPSTAADISKTAADVILQGKCLLPIMDAVDIASRARTLSLQNFALAAGYNAICIPLAISGYVTPLIAAIAMSASSIAVTANAMRLHLRDKERTSS